MEVSGQLHKPAALPQGKSPLLPTGQEAVWTPEPVCTRCRSDVSTIHKHKVKLNV